MNWAAPTLIRDEDVNGLARNRYQFDPAAFGFDPGTTLVGIDENSFIRSGVNGLNERYQNVGGRAQLVDTYKPDDKPWYMKPAAGAALALGLPIGLGMLGAGAFGGAASGGATGAGTAGTAATGAVASPVAAGSATLTNLPALGAAGGASGLGGLLSSAAGTAGNWIKDNPWTAAGLAGLLGAGLSQQMNRPEPQPQYTPRNLGGNFTPQVRAQYQPLPDRSGMTLNTQPGAQGSGLWRFMR